MPAARRSLHISCANGSLLLVRGLCLWFVFLTLFLFSDVSIVSPLPSCLMFEWGEPFQNSLSGSPPVGEGTSQGYSPDGTDECRPELLQPLFPPPQEDTAWRCFRHADALGSSSPPTQTVTCKDTQALCFCAYVHLPRFLKPQQAASTDCPSTTCCTLSPWTQKEWWGSGHSAGSMGTAVCPRPGSHWVIPCPPCHLQPSLALHLADLPHTLWFRVAGVS